jgi:eukaryotic translation initiation factor 2C
VRATIGVSYASPAYYADRLAERGRIYIRDFLAGDAKLKANFNLHKAFVEQKADKLRTAMFPRLKYQRKNSNEEVFDLVERDEIAAELRKWVNGEVAKVWHSEGLERNPWHQRMNESIFWM